MSGYVRATIDMTYLVVGELDSVVGDEIMLWYPNAPDGMPRSVWLSMADVAQLCWPEEAP